MSEVRPDDGGSGQAEPQLAPGGRSATTRSASMRAMRVSRALAKAAFDCFAPQRSTRVWSRSISAFWRAATLAWRASSAARACGYWV